VFQYMEHRDAACDWFVPSWGRWLLRNLCGCFVDQPATICGYQLGSWRALCPCFRKIKLQRAPEPSEIYWQNFGITANQQWCRLVRYSAGMAALVLATGFCVFTLEAIKHSTKRDDEFGALSFAIFVAVFVMVVNELLRAIIIEYTDRELHRTASSRTTSLIAKLTVAYMVNTIAVPMLLLMPKQSTQENNGRDWWEGEGISNTGTLLVVGNSVAPSVYMWLGVDRCLKHCYGSVKAVVQQQLNEAYVPIPFDVAEAWGNFIKTFALGLYFAPFVPLCVPLTAMSLTCQYWAWKRMLITVCANPPAMAATFQGYVRHIIRGVMLVWIFVLDTVFQRACEGSPVCDSGYENSEEDCICSTEVGFVWTVNIVCWCSWTFLPAKDVLCRCFPACLEGCVSQNTAKVAPAPNSPREVEVGFPMSKLERDEKELFDGPGSWTYQLPSPENLNISPAEIEEAMMANVAMKHPIPNPGGDPPNPKTPYAEAHTNSVTPGALPPA